MHQICTMLLTKHYNSVCNGCCSNSNAKTPLVELEECRKWWVSHFEQIFWTNHRHFLNAVWVIDSLYSCWLERQTRDRKVTSSNPSRSGGRIFFSRVNFVCWLLFSVRSTPVLPQWHIKDPGHSAKSAGRRLHLKTHTSLTHLLSRHSVGTYQETSSHTTHQETLGHSRLSSLSHCGLILA